MSEKWARSQRKFIKRVFTPKITNYTKPFWEGTKNHQLKYQQCKNCSYIFFPPQPNCPNCLSADLGWKISAGKGVLATFTNIHFAAPSWMSEKMPYTVIIVRLDEGFTMMSNLINHKPKDIEIMKRVEAVFNDVSDEITLPYFQPVEEQ